MKKWLIFLIIFMMVPAFGAYKLVLRNGSVLTLVKKPDLSGKQVTVETVKGKRMIFPTRFVDTVATRQANAKKVLPKKPKPSIAPVRTKPLEQKISPGEKKSRKLRVPLVITNETLKGLVTEDEAAKEEEKNLVTETTPVEERSEETEPTDDQGHTEEYWREKFTENLDLQAGIRKDLKKMQTKLNAMVSQRLQTDDELEKRSLAGKIQALQNQMDKAKAQLEKLKQDKKKLLEKARTSGALPGWYRDYED